MSSLKISLITPNKNGAAFIEKTIRSVIEQQYSNLEYIVADGASTDASMQIIENYRSHITRVITEPDTGHTDAINKGFAASSGEVMGWINSDDMLLPGALTAVDAVFRAFPDIEWITGRASAMTENGIISIVREVRPWSRLRFLCGDYRHIQQESTFWRRSLWERAGGALSLDYPLASDFELWTRFFREAHLYSLDALIGCFRMRDGQQSIVSAEAYNLECSKAVRLLMNSVSTNDLVSFSTQLAKYSGLLNSTDFRSLPNDIKSEDPPVIRMNNLTRVPYLDGKPLAPNSAKESTSRAGSPLSFDGTKKTTWANGPDFGAEQFVALDVVLESHGTAQFNPNARDNAMPPMPFLVGPVAVYDFYNGQFVVQVKMKTKTIDAHFESRGPTQIRVILNAHDLLVLANGEVVVRETVEEGNPFQDLDQRATLGAGYLQRYWRGDIKELKVVMRSEDGGTSAFDIHDNILAEANTLTKAPGPIPTSDISKLFGSCYGRRCVVMGNGPSLNKMDLSLLKDEAVFACNSAFLLFDRIAWRPQFYTCVDVRVIRDRAKDITRMLDDHPAMIAFFPSAIALHDGSGRRFDTRTIIPPAPNRYYFNEVRNSVDGLPDSMFSLNANKYVVQPFTVAITMLQLAAYLGFNPIYLIGCDTSYVIPKTTKQEGRVIGKHGLLLTSTEDDDPNHFDPRYFGKGREWHNPQVDKMIEHHTWAKAALDPLGIEVLNATVGGQLEVYPRVDYQSVVGVNSGLAEVRRFEKMSIA